MHEASQIDLEDILGPSWLPIQDENYSVRLGDNPLVLYRVMGLVNVDGLIILVKIMLIINFIALLLWSTSDAGTLGNFVTVKFQYLFSVLVVS